MSLFFIVFPANLVQTLIYLFESVMERWPISTEVLRNVFVIKIYWGMHYKKKDIKKI